VHCWRGLQGGRSPGFLSPSDSLLMISYVSKVSKHTLMLNAKCIGQPRGPVSPSSQKSIMPVFGPISLPHFSLKKNFNAKGRNSSLPDYPLNLG